MWNCVRDRERCSYVTVRTFPNSTIKSCSDCKHFVLALGCLLNLCIYRAWHKCTLSPCHWYTVPIKTDIEVVTLFTSQFCVGNSICIEHQSHYMHIGPGGIPFLASIGMALLCPSTAPSHSCPTTWLYYDACDMFMYVHTEFMLLICMGVFC